MERRGGAPLQKNGSRDSQIMAEQQPSSQINQTGCRATSDEDERTMEANTRDVDDGSNGGYQRYLLTFHHPSAINDDGTNGGQTSF